MKTIGRFGYRVHYIGQTAYTHILLGSHSVLDDGADSLTPSLTPLEIDGYVQALKDDLDAVAQRAKAAIKRGKQETKLWYPD